MELDLRVAHLTCIRRLRRELDNMHTYFFIMFWSSVDAARPQFLHTYYHIPFVVLHWRLCDWSLRRRVVCAVVCRYLYPPGVHVTGRHVLSEQISGRGNFMLMLIHRNIIWGSFMVLTLTVVRLVIVHVCGLCSCLSIQNRQTCMITVNTYICQACVITVRTLDSGGLVIEGLSFRDRMRA